MALLDVFLGEVRLFAGDFAPTGWAICDGSLVKIADEQLLYRMLGTRYGGDGTTHFALPDLRGRVPVGVGHGTGLSNYDLAQTGGVAVVALSNAELPKHTHQVFVSSASANTITPGPTVAPATTDTRVTPYSHSNTATGNYHSYAPDGVSVTGGYDAHDNMMPSIGINFIIALQGTWPSP